MSGLKVHPTHTRGSRLFRTDGAAMDRKLFLKTIESFPSSSSLFGQTAASRFLVSYAYRRHRQTHFELYLGLRPKRRISDGAPAQDTLLPSNLPITQSVQFIFRSNSCNLLSPADWDASHSPAVLSNSPQEMYVWSQLADREERGEGGRIR